MTEILLYGIIGDNWDGLDAATIVPMISGSDDDLDVRINSAGGYVMEGLAILNALVRAQQDGRKVTTHIDGLAASMASVIAMAGEDRIMADNALMMIHNPWDIAMGDAAELRRAADKLDLIRDQLVKVYAQKTGIAADDLVAMLEAETWFTAEQALEQNFVTEISSAVTAAACDVSAFGFRKAPDSPHLVTSPAAVLQSIVTGGATVGISSAVAAVMHPGKDKSMPPANPAAQPSNAPNDKSKTTPALQPADTPAALTEADAKALADTAVAAERKRVSDIRALVKKHDLGEDFADELINDGTISLDAARAKILDKLADRSDDQQIGFNAPILVGADARQKFIEGASNWIMVRAGVASMVEKAAKARGETLNTNLRGA